MVDIEYKQQLAIREMLRHSYTLLYGGSRSGKSFIVMFQMLIMANKYKCRQLIVRMQLAAVKRSVIFETLPKVAELLGISYKLNQQESFIVFPNGAEIWYGGIDEGRGLDRVLGKEYLNIWINEASEIAYSAYGTLQTRLAEQVLKKDKKGNPVYKKDNNNKYVLNAEGKRIREQVKNRIFIDENPPKKSHWTYKIFFDNIEPESRTLLSNPEQYGVIQLNPKDNEKNVSEDNIKRLESLPPKLRKRFLLGEFSDDVLGALFTESTINQYRVIKHPYLKQVVVSIDPAITSKSTSDDTGMIVVGKGEDDRGYLLEDKSGIYKPEEWASTAVKLYEKWNADYIVAEINQGGEMVKSTIRNFDKNVPVKTVHATKGKMLRAEPISMMYDDGRISHVGSFPDAEDEMISYTGAEGEKSPNRLDALVHGFTFLFPIGRSTETEYFNRDKIKFFNNYDLTGSKKIGYIRLTDAIDYYFTMVILQIKDRKIFVSEILFNDYVPYDNMKGIEQMIIDNTPETVFIECSLSYSSFVRELYTKGLKTAIRGVKAESSEENRVLIQSGFIVDKFLFREEVELAQYKDFMRQFHSYNSISEPDQRYAPSALAGISTVIKKLYQNLI